MHYIYTIQNKKDNRIYIGQSKKYKHRWRSHIRDAERSKTAGKKRFVQVIDLAIAKYGIDAFEFQVIEEWETQDDANDAEVFWIAFFMSRNREYGFNVTEGGKSVSGPGHHCYGKPSPKRLFNEEEEKEICAEYTLGKSSYKIAKERNCQKTVILNVLNKHKVQKRNNKKFSIEKEKEICNVYVNGEYNSKDLAKIYNCGNRTILKILKRYGINIKQENFMLKHRTFTNEQENKIRIAFERLGSGVEVGKIYNITSNRVYKIINREKYKVTCREMKKKKRIQEKQQNNAI